MTRRNPMNERYQEDTHTGSTRKSAASAKPKSQAASTTHAPAPKSKKQKKEEAREREMKMERKRRILSGDSGNGYDVPTPEFKKLKRRWWGVLIAAIITTALAFAASTSADFAWLSMVLLVASYVLIIIAFYIDLGPIRRMRKSYFGSLNTDKSKAARAEQKRRMAAARVQEKEAEEKYKDAKAEEERKKEERKAKGPLGWFRKSKGDAKQAKDDLQAKAEAVKAIEGTADADAKDARAGKGSKNAKDAK